MVPVNRMRFRLLLLFIIYAIVIVEGSSSSRGNQRFETKRRFDTFARRILAVGLLAPTLSINQIIPSVSYAAQQVEVSPNDLKRLKMGLREITYLIDNWDEKTTYCNFGEFQRDLLLPENKGKLLDAAKEFSLWDYDKSKTMNVMCKRDPQVVR